MLNFVEKLLTVWELMLEIFFWGGDFFDSHGRLDDLLEKLRDSTLKWHSNQDDGIRENESTGKEKRMQDQLSVENDGHKFTSVSPSALISSYSLSYMDMAVAAE